MVGGAERRKVIVMQATRKPSCIAVTFEPNTHHGQTVAIDVGTGITRCIMRPCVTNPSYSRVHSTPGRVCTTVVRWRAAGAQGMLDTLVHIPNVSFSNEVGNKASIKMSN
ncbi:hypothetical protein V2G26_020996 [Clonostachys chloroleuca]